MQIIIPMSGEGARFKRAGYTVLKPLILVDGKPIIEHVINLFPGEENFIFICREEHLEETNMRELLLTLKPSAKIVSMPGEKLGPVNAVTKAFDLIGDEEPTIVNYCDFSMVWDYKDFKSTVLQENYDACLPVYTGFHPHLIHEKNLYASIKVDANGYLAEIREKFSYTEDKTQSMHSPGTHYFKRGSDVKKFFKQLIDEKIDLNGEYYASLVYNLLVRDGLKIGVYDKISHFCQWGTPEDLEEYNFWIKTLKNNQDCISLAKEKLPNHSQATLEKIVKYWQSYLNKNI